jgi:cytochrome c oxidase subunit 2
VSVFQPNSPQAAAISENFAIALWLSAAILALVVALVVTLLVRHRCRREDDPDPDPVYGNTPLEIGWTAAPLVICLGLFALALATMGTAGPPPVPGREPDLVVVGHQWWWEARYPASGVVAANEIHIPTGRDLLVRVESADVIHDFWVAQLGPVPSSAARSTPGCCSTSSPRSPPPSPPGWPARG